jgi:hypothetical protein
VALVAGLAWMFHLTPPPAPDPEQQWAVRVAPTLDRLIADVTSASAPRPGRAPASPSSSPSLSPSLSPPLSPAQSRQLRVDVFRARGAGRAPDPGTEALWSAALDEVQAAATAARPGPLLEQAGLSLTAVANGVVPGAERVAGPTG